jgi:hypothetical protein
MGACLPVLSGRGQGSGFAHEVFAGIKELCAASLPQEAMPPAKTRRAKERRVMGGIPISIL